MGVRQTWWRFAFTRPHLFLLTAPGGAAVRLAVERWARENGWPLAGSAADTDVLVLAAGAHVPEAIAAAAEQIWSMTPQPRARLRLTDPDRVAEKLLQARTALLAAAGSRPLTGERAEHFGMHDSSHDAERPASAMSRGIANSAHSGHQMGHADHDMGDMEMPAGLPVAEEAPDRDGVALDALRISLGPALAHWPAGLRLDLTIQGDVVQRATVDALPAITPSLSLTGAARRLDGLTRLFAIAGADRFALQAARIRDDLLTGADRDTAARVDRLRARASRAWLLRSLTDRIPLDPDGRLFGLPAPVDVTTRWRRWLDEALIAPSFAEPDPHRTLAALPDLITGRELSEVRLIVAAVDPDLDSVGVMAGHG